MRLKRIDSVAELKGWQSPDTNFPITYMNGMKQTGWRLI